MLIRALIRAICDYKEMKAICESGIAFGIHLKDEMAKDKYCRNCFVYVLHYLWMYYRMGFREIAESIEYRKIFIKEV